MQDLLFDGGANDFMFEQKVVQCLYECIVWLELLLTILIAHYQRSVIVDWDISSTHKTTEFIFSGGSRVYVGFKLGFVDGLSIRSA